MHKTINKYILLVLIYGLVTNATAFVEVYIFESVEYYLILEYFLSGTVAIMYLLDWKKITSVPTYLKVLLLPFLFLESYVGLILVIVILLYENRENVSSFD